MLLRKAPIAVFLVLAGAGMGGAGCSNGTTPECDDAGSCLILPPSGDAGMADTESTDADDGAVE
jgi:hypothetical protein